MWPFDYDVIGYLLILAGLAVVAFIWSVVQTVANNLRCRFNGSHRFRPITSMLGKTVYHDQECVICGKVEFAQTD